MKKLLVVALLVACAGSGVVLAKRSTCGTSKRCGSCPKKNNSCKRGDCGKSSCHRCR